MEWMFSLIGLFSIYSIIPTILIRSFSYRIVKRKPKDKQFALTFDDGPHPVYTSRLLDLLKEFDMKATFFVVTTNARRHPEIIQRMRDEGHEIGVHHDEHISTWVMTPFQVGKQLRRSREAIIELTGDTPVYYRPPWGHFNISTLFVVKPFQVVMWSDIFQDWKLSMGKNRLARNMRSRLSDGAIFVLHDNGDTFGADQEAPEMMLEALEQFLPYVKERGYKSVTVRTLLQDT
ncbi:polysaccharide deacetylase family protein [Bacillus songklensis]|uniref:Polysaccharide deacetylase family protein n=1 Tax=Bacillus songklensis TaxID=1069116 RepID=A0ABV8B9Q4_9BACI